MKKKAELELNLSTRRTRRAVFLVEMELLVPRRELIALIAATSPVTRAKCPRFARENMLRVHFLRQWFGLSDRCMEEALFETSLYSGTDRKPLAHAVGIGIKLLLVPKAAQGRAGGGVEGPGAASTEVPLESVTNTFSDHLRPGSEGSRGAGAHPASERGEPAGRLG